VLRSGHDDYRPSADDRAARDQALGRSEPDVEAGRLVDAAEVLRNLTRAITSSVAGCDP
jgi:hypothetical protein